MITCRRRRLAAPVITNMKISNTSEIGVKLIKMTRLAFDPAAPAGEASSALNKVVEIAKRNGVCFEDFKNLFINAEGGSGASEKKNASPPMLCRMPFGQYASRTFDEIYGLNPDYLKWAAKAFWTHPMLREQIQLFCSQKIQLTCHEP